MNPIPEPLWSVRPGPRRVTQLPERAGDEHWELPTVSQPGGWEVRKVRLAPTASRAESFRHNVDVLIIGAGQAGLAAGQQLQRRGIRGFADDDASSRGNFVILDAEETPGGAWQHRWPTLTMATVNDVANLPGLAQQDNIPVTEPARSAVPRYFSQYEDHFDLPILRPVRVYQVEREDNDPAGRLLARTDAGTYAARAVINATGTWSRPFWPYIRGQADYQGAQLHSHDYPGPEPFRGMDVIIVGGGISGLGHVMEISTVADTTWVTRRPPQWRTTPFDSTAGLEVERLVAERVREGRYPLSVVSLTGLLKTPETEEARARGALEHKPMFSSIEPEGVRWPDGSFQAADAIVWATGFRHELRHLAPLKLRTKHGGIRVEGTQAIDEPRLHLAGYGPSASTIGAGWAGRRAARAIDQLISRDDLERAQ